jgi:hypothetical protein
VRLTKEELIDLYQPRSGRTSCPTEEELVLATTNELPEVERNRVAAHLMACRDCAEEYSLIRPLKAFAQQAAAAETARQPSGITIREAGDDRITQLPWWRRFKMDLYYVPAPFAMAALLLLISVALAVWLTSIRRENRLALGRLEEEVAQRDQAARSATESLDETQRQLEEIRRRYEEERSSGHRDNEIAELRRAVEELSRPQLNAPIIQLEPQSSVRGQPSAETVIEVPSGASLFTLVLNVAGQQSHSSYALEILDQSGKIIWQGRGLRRSPYNTFTVALARRLLPAGQYHIKLYGLDGNRREIVEDFAVRVQYR